MEDIVSRGRQIINNITRSATVFLFKNIFSMLLAIIAIIATFNYPLVPSQVSLVTLFNTGVPAFLLSLEPNTRKQKKSFFGCSRHTENKKGGYGVRHDCSALCIWRKKSYEYQQPRRHCDISYGDRSISALSPYLATVQYVPVDRRAADVLRILPVPACALYP